MGRAGLWCELLLLTRTREHALTSHTVRVQEAIRRSKEEARQREIQQTRKALAGESEYDDRVVEQALGRVSCTSTSSLPTFSPRSFQPVFLCISPCCAYPTVGCCEPKLTACVCVCFFFCFHLSIWLAQRDRIFSTVDSPSNSKEWTDFSVNCFYVGTFEVGEQKRVDKDEVKRGIHSMKDYISGQRNAMLIIQVCHAFREHQ